MYPIGSGPSASTVSPVAMVSFFHESIVQVPSKSFRSATALLQFRRLLDEWWCVPNLGQEPNFPCSTVAHIYRSPMAVGVCTAVSALASYMELAPCYYCVAPKRRNFIECRLSTQGTHFELVLIKLLDGLRSQRDSR